MSLSLVFWNYQFSNLHCCQDVRMWHWILLCTSGAHLNFSSKLPLKVVFWLKSRLWTHHGLRITDQLFKSNLTFCVVCVFILQTDDEWCVPNRLCNADFEKNQQILKIPTFKSVLATAALKFNFFENFEKNIWWNTVRSKIKKNLDGHDYNI
jgi:hypothetical protein